jgi:hypothetical protein
MPAVFGHASNFTACPEKLAGILPGGGEANKTDGPSFEAAAARLAGVRGRFATTRESVRFINNRNIKYG